MNIENNKYLFYICAGLTATGSEGYNHSDMDVLKLVNNIREAEFPDNLKIWFALARTGQIAVNPYWPRGSSLAAACFFVNDRYEFDINSFFSFLESVGGISDPIGIADFKKWIGELPNILRKMDALHSTPFLWKEYCDIVTMRLPEWCDMVEKAVKTVKIFFEGDGPEIIFNPNLLTHYSTDFVRIGNRIITISPDPDMESMLHETMHTAVAASRKEITDFAAKNCLSKFADRFKMIEFGYMEDDSVESIAHVIEECFVRALAVTLSGGTDERLRTHAEYGCESVPFIASCVREINPTNSTLNMFIQEVLTRMRLISCFS